MQCPRCSSNGFSIENKTAIASSLEGIGGDVIYSGSCIICGYWRAVVDKPVKPMPPKYSRTEHIDTLPNGEPTKSAVRRCNDYFARYKEFIKVQLSNGRRLHVIVNELAKRHDDFPKLTWIRKTYLSWVDQEAQ